MVKNNDQNTGQPVGIPDKLIKVSQVVTAGTVIIGGITGVYIALDNRFIERVGEQIEGVRAEMQESDENTDRKLTRLELMNLIQNQPTNVAEIERVARHYFIDLNGDWYITKFYSEWAALYGGDITFIANKENE